MDYYKVPQELWERLLLTVAKHLTIEEGFNLYAAMQQLQLRRGANGADERKRKEAS